MASGKFVLRLDPEFHASLKDEARSARTSLNSLCLKKLQSVPASPLFEVLSKIVSRFNPKGVLLFGSMARGEAKATSDIDLLIVLPEEVEINRSLYSKWDLEFSEFDKCSPQFVHFPKIPDVGSIWLETAIEGEILFDPQNEVRRNLIEIRKLISEGRFIRKLSYGHSYWIRQDSDAK